jgi:hypothetical protein
MLLSPFWCLDAKGGEVVLVGLPWGFALRIGSSKLVLPFIWFGELYFYLVLGVW